MFIAMLLIIAEIWKQLKWPLTEEWIKKMKTQPSELQKIFANEATDKGLITKIYKHIRQLNIKKGDQSKFGWKA